MRVLLLCSSTLQISEARAMLCQCLYTCWPWRPEVFLLLQWINSFQVFPVPKTSRRGCPTIPTLTHTHPCLSIYLGVDERVQSHNPKKLLHHLLRWEENKNLLDHQSGFTLSSKCCWSQRKSCASRSYRMEMVFPAISSFFSTTLSVQPLIKPVLGSHFSELSLHVIFTDRLKKWQEMPLSATKQRKLSVNFLVWIAKNASQVLTYFILPCFWVVQDIKWNMHGKQIVAYFHLSIWGGEGRLPAHQCHV